MNKILNINLGGFALTIDDDAFEYLSAYLDSIKRRFSESEGRDEILHDIEMRLGELITAELGNRTIVMLPDVEAAVQIMGKPEDFGGEPIDNRRRMGNKSKGVHTGKRLFRDEEDKVAGGVCSGIAAYLGMSDPVWIRLSFVILTLFTSGSWAIAYILLWILVPPATTAADRLAMRGQPVNVDNIAKEIEEGFERMGEQFNKIGKDAKKKSGPNEPSAPGVLASILSVIGSLFAFFVKFIASFGGILLIILAITAILTLFFGWGVGLWGLSSSGPLMSFVSPFSGGINLLGMSNLFLLLALPVIGILLGLARAFLKVRVPGWLGISIFILWLINLFSFGAIALTTAKSFKEREKITQMVDLSDVTSDTLRVEWSERPQNWEDEEDWFHGDGFRLHREQLQVQHMIDISVTPGASGHFEYSREVQARGTGVEDALRNAESIAFEARLDGNTLRVPPYYSINKGKKWRVQEIKLNFFVPIGKYIVFGEDINTKVHNTDYDDRDPENRIYRRPNRVFRMTENGLVCADCPAFGDSGYESRKSYENFILEGKFQTEIVNGSRFKLRFEPENSADALEITRAGDNLTLIAKDGQPTENLKVFIQTPVITDLYINGGQLNIRGFDEGRSSITARNDAVVRAYFESNDLELNQSEESKISLFGKGNSLRASLSGDARLDALSWRCDKVRISATENAEARAFARDKAEVTSSKRENVTIEGGADIEYQNE